MPDTQDSIPRRHCGDCRLRCKLLPVVPLHKLAGERCRHQKHGKGCAVYHKAGFPPECGLWNCRWLVNDAGATSRPDRAHYVINLLPDFIVIEENDTGKREPLQVVQIWLDPNYPDAHRDPALREWLARQAEQGIAALVRSNSKTAFMIFAPALSGDGQWHEAVSNCRNEGQHSPADIEAALGKAEIFVALRT